MANVKEKSKQRLNTANPSSLVFGLFSCEEILQLSVTKVSVSNTFDAIGHPVSGGLYDPLMGPIDKFGSCATCFNNILDCPGHFGYIDLPVPVINPFFNDVVIKIMKLACLKCHTVVIPYKKKFILINQLRLLAAGNLTEALEFEAYFSKQEEIPAEFNKEVYDDMVLKLGENIDKISENRGKMVNNVTESRSVHTARELFINAAVKSMALVSCFKCHERIQKIRVYNKQIVTNVKVEVAQKFKEGGHDDGSVSYGGQNFVMPSDIMVHLRKIWKNDSAFLTELLPVLKTTSAKYPTDLFFFLVVPVPPSNVRPANFLKGKVSEHEQNKLYKVIIDDCFVVKSIIHLLNDSENSVSENCKLLISQINGSSLAQKLQFALQSLQSNCNLLLAPDRGNKIGNESLGLKEILEKKEGIIRMHMMGKRVNFAARSVITPDPNLNIDEIGIPEEFAKKLTYPVPVTPWNVKLLRKMVMNGPDIHPGAIMVELEDGTKVRISSTDPTQRESIAKQLLTPGSSSGDDKTSGTKTLHRHLINGDVLLMNRQPTLHKPGIMAHRARILKGEKTIRLHYSNCKSYNADFDGDEMNVHFPQNELARSEGYNIVSVCNQYLVPKDGTPLGGLIQDHMVSGVRLSVRGKFFSRADYMQLVFRALPYVHGDIKILPPAIIKPLKLWSGKQIISTVILNIIPKGKKPINLFSTAKISSRAWLHGKERVWKAGGSPFKNPNTMSEAEVVIRDGELLCGVLDKMHYGATPYSLVHCMYELYGGECSSKLLSAFGKLFTAFLQTEGFTLGVKDILVTKQADKKRLEYIEAIKEAGNEAATKALDLPLDTDESELKLKLEEAYRKDPKFRQTIDRQYKNTLDTFTNEINTACVPNGLIERFPHNNLQLMVQSGAKGSTVNTMQISCLLGQIELEGKRPPLMISGRPLPSFPPYETSARAGGFVDGRFMTGIQPQEFFFHCMAGREGLIDTAVKTSRSGYLQRCLIKHLEGLTINYDMTVRDSDGSVMQFLYGEDGMDISKAQFFNKSQIPFLLENSEVVVNEDVLNKVKDENIERHVKKYRKKMKSWKKFCHDIPICKRKQTPFSLFCTDMEETVSNCSSKDVSKGTGRSKRALKLCKMWLKLDDMEKSVYYKKCTQCPSLLTEQFQPDRDFGVISERLDALMNDYLKSRGGNVLSSDQKLQDMIRLKSMTSMCSPGEPVGILAAQSVGEPSTQMTLNTFHFAGRGEMNVTLGIPRLREILMMASKTIKTPSVEVPFRENISQLEKKADKLRKYLTRITLADVLEYASVTERQTLEEPNRKVLYVIYFKLLPLKVYGIDTHIKPRHILRHIEQFFLRDLVKIGPKKKDGNLISTEDTTNRKRVSRRKDDDENNIIDEGYNEESPQETEPRRGTKRGVDSESSEEEPEADDDDATTAKIRARRTEEQEYEEKEEDDEEGYKDGNGDGQVFGDDDDGDNKSDEEKGAEIGQKEEKERTAYVIDSNQSIEKYRFDTENQLWCEVTISYPHYVGRIDFSSVLREKACASVIHEVPGIRRAFVYESDDKLMLKTDGCNYSEMFRHDDLLDINKIHSNDIHGMAETYGIEAAVKVIVKEVQDVFKVYGITVDPRHLSLVADYMTFDGTIQPLNRAGIVGNVSPLQQMSFETSTAFLKTAILQAKKDSLNSPSSCLILGKPAKVGTGVVDVRLSSSIFSSA